MEIELLVVEGWAELGVIPKNEAELIRGNAQLPNPGRLAGLEARTQHEMAAFVDALGEMCGPEGRRWIHFGLTSSDVLDTALSIQIRKSLLQIEQQLDDLIDTLIQRALNHRATLCVGRTHGIHAGPTTFGHRLAVACFQLDRDRTRLQQARQIISVGKISGALGNYAQGEPRLEQLVCSRLDLTPSCASTQILQRDRHAQCLYAMASLATTLETFALEIRNRARTEAGEIRESFSATQKGSSAMPHKQNPILSERICGLARSIRSQVQVGFENVSLWHERDISHSSAERIAFPQTCELLSYSVELMHQIVKGWHVDTARMRKNLEITRGLIYSERILHFLILRGLTRNDAYRQVQAAANETLDGEVSFLDALVAQIDPALATRTELLELMKPDQDSDKLGAMFSQLARMRSRQTGKVDSSRSRQ